ncbi:MAG: glycosyltransferase family 4 protein, partial [Terriglobia bacterium]
MARRFRDGGRWHGGVRVELTWSSMARPGMMKIAFVNHPLAFPVPPQRGSLPIWVHAVARRLAHSHSVIVYALRGQLPESEWCEGVLYRRVSMPKWAPKWKSLLNKTPLLWRINSSSVESRWHQWEYGLAVAADLRRQKCDIIHLTNLFHLVPVIRRLNPRSKIVLHMQCEWLNRLNRALVEPRLKRVDMILGCSEHITGKIRQAFPQFANRCRTVFNGVDAARFVPNGSDNLSGTAHRVLWAGRLSPEKGVHVLLDAFAQVVKRCPGAQLEIAGPEERMAFDVLLICDDPAKMAPLEPFYRTKSYLAQLKAQAASLGIADRVIFRGLVPYASLEQCYRGADMLVIPSFTETFGITLVEAMACEVPVVATRVGGIPEVVKNGESGILVEPGDPSALADAILRVL